MKLTKMHYNMQIANDIEDKEIRFFLMMFTIAVVVFEFRVYTDIKTIPMYCFFPLIHIVSRWTNNNKKKNK